MKIESLIKRKNGTIVELDEHRYHFKPSATDPRHLADVKVKAHISRLLAIPEGFQVADEELPEDPEEQPGPVTGTLTGVQEADGSVRTLDQLDEIELRAIAIEMEIEGARELPVAELIAAIQAEEVEIDGIDTSAPVKTEQQGDEQPGKTDEQAAETEEKKSEQPAEGETREALAEQYKAKFGKAPHHKLSAERIKQILTEDEGE